VLGIQYEKVKHTQETSTTRALIHVQLYYSVDANRYMYSNDIARCTRWRFCSATS
jgi:hypothetical protein